MARRTPTVPLAGGRIPAAVPAAAHAVLLVLLVLLGPSGPPAPGGADLPAPGGLTHAAGVPSAHGTPHAQDADPAVPSATVRSGRDVTGERHTPPLPASHPPRGATGGPLRAGRTPVGPPPDPPASALPAHGHGVRAPPSFSGT
ncbi:hypothetical protein PYK79_15880 [Streptomyces sp. ID05-04B]|uniref:hypothetical protein n=1 Tax=unclassified Streptomyces TaxID=2593676 RepID=UPI000D1AE2EB|nr:MULTISPECIES: hypothetical protein [unclassified Streptomyces]AVV44065.1 hypothetical protein C6376_24065 [Streptomyces sp. P3]MDX5564530.1 hypothetical protein [Streptomyces sp. ID05-04B]